MTGRHEYCEIDFPDGAGRFQAAFDSPSDVLAAFDATDVPGVLGRVEALAREGCHAVGYVAYEAAAALDPAYKLAASANGLPLALFAIYPAAAVAPKPRDGWMCGVWQDALSREKFDPAVEAIRRGISAGDYYQVNFTSRLRAAFLGDSLGLFDALKVSQPDAWCAYLDFGRWQICSVSPELFFLWQAGDGDGRLLCSRPMKGTAARHADQELDQLAAQQLRHSAKECAENLMIVDLIRNDISRVAELGSVRVPELFTVEQWPTVWQMTSTVEGRSKTGTQLADVFAALFPCGSVTGAPKIAAMSAIARLETAPRGVYCGAIGVVKPGGEAVFSVGIRTVVVDTQHGVAECGVGSGIVMDSVAAAEHVEWQTKRRFLDHACGDYELLETLRLHAGRYWLRLGHLERMRRSASQLGFVFREGVVQQALNRLASRHVSGDWRVRLRLATDGEVQVEAFALEASPSVGTVATAANAVNQANPWLRHKTTRRGIYQALAVSDPRIFDTLLFNEHGEATEFTRGNLVAEIAGQRVTPPVSCGLLAGVYRDALLKRKRLVERVVTCDELQSATSVWFINSVRGAIPVRFLTSTR